MTRLICPKHPDDDTRYYLTLRKKTARCADCGYTCRNFIAEPIHQIYDMNTGEITLKNVLTGETVEDASGRAEPPHASC